MGHITTWSPNYFHNYDVVSYVAITWSFVYIVTLITLSKEINFDKMSPKYFSKPRFRSSEGMMKKLSKRSKWNFKWLKSACLMVSWWGSTFWLCKGFTQTFFNMQIPTKLLDFHHCKFKHRCIHVGTSVDYECIVRWENDTTIRLYTFNVIRLTIAMCPLLKDQLGGPYHFVLC